MPVVQDYDAISDVPTEDAPEHGVICREGVVVSDVLHWVEDGDHVFRSTEFDVIAGDADLATAADKFVQNAEDLADFYVDARRDLTEIELEHAIRLLQRFTEIYRSENRLLEARSRRLSVLIAFLRLRSWRRAHDLHRGRFRPALTP